jgi:hypothetical protein
VGSVSLINAEFGYVVLSCPDRKSGFESALLFAQLILKFAGSSLTLEEARVGSEMRWASPLDGGTKGSSMLLSWAHREGLARQKDVTHGPGVCSVGDGRGTYHDHGSQESLSSREVS